MKKIGSWFVKMVMALALIFGLTSAAHAQGTMGDLTSQATEIVTTASTTVTTVAAVVAGVVGFFIVIAIVKWVRTR